MMMSNHEKIREVGEGSSSNGGGGAILIASPSSDNHHRQSSSSGGSGGVILIAPPSSDNHYRQSSSSGGGGGRSGPSDNHHQQSSSLVPLSTPQLSRYESQKRRDWNTFGQYLKNQRPPVPLPQCNYSHVLDFLRYLDQFGKTKVHLQGCLFFGQPEPPGPCTCPLRQAWGSLDALIGRLRAAYEENGGLQENNPFASGAIRVYLREVRDAQAKARGIPYKKKKKKRLNLQIKASNNNNNDHDGATSANFQRN